METRIIMPKNDQERIDALRNIYLNATETGMSQLPIATEMVGYVKPFLHKLSENSFGSNLAATIMMRQVVDELLSDIYRQVADYCRKTDASNAFMVANAFGLKVEAGRVISINNYLAQVA